MLRHMIFSNCLYHYLMCKNKKLKMKKLKKLKKKIFYKTLYLVIYFTVYLPTICRLFADPLQYNGSNKGFFTFILPKLCCLP